MVGSGQVLGPGSRILQASGSQRENLSRPWGLQMAWHLEVNEGLSRQGRACHVLGPAFPEPGEVVFIPDRSRVCPMLTRPSCGAFDRREPCAWVGRQWRPSAPPPHRGPGNALGFVGLLCSPQAGARHPGVNRAPLLAGASPAPPATSAPENEPGAGPRPPG